MKTILLMLPKNNIREESLERIRQLAPGMRVLITQERKEVEVIAEEIEIAAGGVPRDLIPLLTNLRWFQQWGAGADWLIDKPALVKQDFILTNASGVHAVPISEHIFAMILAFARDLPDMRQAQGEHHWLNHESDDVFELEGKTMLLVGVGAIGERTATIAKAFSMRVFGIRRNPSQLASGVDQMYGPDQLHTVLPMADFVVLTIPLTPETAGLIGERELRLMKPSAYLFNIGRGKTIQQEHLLTALQEGWIAGAGLDVFETEPLPKDSPLWDLDNLIVTSHYAGQTPLYMNRAMAIFLDNLERYQKGQPLQNIVHKELAY